MDVRMPDGTLVRGVPDNITQQDLLARFTAYQKQSAPATPAQPVAEEPAAPTEPTPEVPGRQAPSMYKTEGVLENMGFWTDPNKPKPEAPATPQERAANAKQQAELAQLKKDYAYKPEDSIGNDLENIGIGLARAGKKAGLALKQGAGGTMMFLEDMVGADNVSAKSKATLGDYDKQMQALGDPKNRAARLVEGAVTSIGQQLPALGLGVVTGTELPVLGNMFMNSFGQTYDESRRNDMDVEDATKRAGIFAAFEVVGEKFGLGDALAGIKAAAKGVSTKELTKYFAKSLAKEVPGEELTYAGQYATDKAFDQNQLSVLATRQQEIDHFLTGAADTLYATLIQGGLMMGGGHAINKIASTLQKDNPELSAEQARKAALDKWKKEGQLALASTTAQDKIDAEVHADAVKKYLALGQTKENAVKLADQDIADQKEADDARRIDSGTTGESIQVPGQPAGEPIAGGTNEPVGPTVAGPGSTTGTTEAGTVSEPAPLEAGVPEQAPPVTQAPPIEQPAPIEQPTPVEALHAPLLEAMHDSGIQFKNPSQVKKILTYAMPEVAELAKENPKIYKELLEQWKAAPIPEVQAPEVQPAPEVQMPEVPAAPPQVQAPPQMPPATAPVPEPEKRSNEKRFVSSTPYTIDTEDNGVMNYVVHRTPEGGAVIVGEDGHLIENNPAFAKDKSDEELLKYNFEPYGYKSSAPQQQAPAPEALPFLEEPPEPHITEAKTIAAKLQSIDPEHPMLDVLRDEINVTPDDVHVAKLELEELRKKPETAVAPPPTFASPDDQVKTAHSILNNVFDPSAYEDIKDIKEKHQEHKDERIQTIAGLQDLINNPQYADTYVASAAEDLLNHPSIQKEELQKAAALSYPARQEQNDIITKQAIAADEQQANEILMSAQATEPNQSIRARPSANIARLADLLGPQLYGDLSNMAQISVKELFQNSFDAIKALVEREGKTDGRIDITTDRTARTITIADNGNGMTPDIILKAFLTLAGTNKETERSSGGFGIAKMQFLFGSERLQLSTVRNGVKSTLDTSGKQLKEALDDESKSPSIHTEATNEPNGTTVTVTIPKSFKDASTGEDKDIDFVSSYEAPESISDSPLFEPITVTYNGDTVNIGASFPSNDYVPFANVKFDWGNARIIVAKEESNAFKYKKNIVVLSNGLLQFNQSLKKDPKDMWGENIPRQFFINVEPLVKPEEPGYPFELSRQGFSKTVKADFDKIFNYLNVLYRGNEAALVSQGFGDIEYIENDGKSSGAKKLAPPVSNASESLMLINQGDSIEVLDGKLIVNGREIPELTADTLEKTRIDLTKFKIDQSEIDPSKPMLHTNLGVQQPNELDKLIAERDALDDKYWQMQEDSALGKPVDNAEYNAVVARRAELYDKVAQLQQSDEPIPEGEIKPITEIAREKFGNRFNIFVNNLSNIFMTVRDEAAKTDPARYATLPGLGIGVSFDKEYHGVHIRVPFQAMFVNPAALNYNDIQRQADSLYYTMVHETAHYKQGGHDANFWAEDNQLAIELRVAGVEPLVTHQIRVLLTKNKDILDFLRSTYSDKRTKNIGKQLEDARQSTDVGLDSNTDEIFKDEAKARGSASNQTGPGTTGAQGGNSQPNQQGAGASAQNGNATGVPPGAKKSGPVKVEKIIQKIERSESPENMGSLIGQLMEADSWDDKKLVLKTLWNTLDSKAIHNLLPALTTTQITDWVGDKIPHLNQVNRYVERMSVMRSKMLAAISDTVKPWADFAKAHAKGANLLSRVMHYSTLAEVDPTIYNNVNEALAKDPQLVELRRLMNAASNPRSRAAYKGQITTREGRISTAYKLWKDLGTVGNGEGHSLFKKVRDHYRTIFNLHRAILDERIAKSSIAGDIDDASTPKGKLMASIRQTYEDAKKVGVYFPLMRYGNYWMSLGKGVNKEFYMFESEVQRNLFINKRVAQLQKAGDPRSYQEIMESGEFDAGNDLTKLRSITSEASEMLQGIFKIIDSQTSGDKEELKDAVYQMYLLTMPEQSFRKQFIHRKGTTGFSGDALRNFVRSGYSSANQLSRLQYAPDITTEMDSAHASLEGMPPKEKIKLGLFLNEIGIRVGEELSSPNEDEFWTRFANGINQTAFLFRLTSPKSAIANMTAIPVFGLPVLASKYGEVKAAAALAKYYNVFNHTTFVTPDGKYTPLSVGLSKHVQSNRVLAAAFEEAAERGITEITRTYDLIAMARTPSTTHQGAISRGTRAFINFAGMLFHHSERLNREIMFMTSFELAYNKAVNEGLAGGINGPAFTRAIDEAVKNTYDSMFNYTKYNRPRIMRKPAARVVFQFKLFPQQVTAYFVRNFWTMVKGADLNPRARREATTQFVGTILMTSLFAGIVGMPLFSLILGTIQGIRDAFRDKDDPIPIEERDLNLWFRNKWLPEHFGAAAKYIEKGPISALTNIDIGSSTSLNNLWFRDSKYDASMANQFNDFIINMAGPGASLAEDAFKAYDDFRTGHFNEGVEKLLPGLAKGLFTQYVWGKEGIKVKGSQAEIFNKEEVTAAMRFWKAFGFNPTELTRIQESNYPAMELVRRAQDERKAIMNRLDLELARGDDAAFEKAIIDATRFTTANPEMKIMPDTIINSELKRAKLRAMADRGLIVPPKLMPRIFDLVHASRPDVNKEQEQARFDALMRATEATPEEEE